MGASGPYVVTVKRPCPACVHGPNAGGEHRPESVSRVAVATLDEAIAKALEVTLPYALIEVSQLPWFKLAIEAHMLPQWQQGADTPWVENTKRDILAAFNAREAQRGQ